MAAQASCEERLDSVSWQIPPSSFQTRRKGRCVTRVKFYFESSSSTILTLQQVSSLFQLGFLTGGAVLPSEPILQSRLEHEPGALPAHSTNRDVTSCFPHQVHRFCSCNALGNDLAQGWSLAPWEPAAPGQWVGTEPRSSSSRPGHRHRRGAQGQHVGDAPGAASTTALLQIRCTWNTR